MDIVVGIVILIFLAMLSVVLLSCFLQFCILDIFLLHGLGAANARFVGPTLRANRVSALSFLVCDEFGFQFHGDVLCI